MMRPVAKSVLFAIAFYSTACAAEPVSSDPCETPETKGSHGTLANWRIDVSRDIGIYIAKHVQRTCQLLNEMSQPGTLPPSNPELSNKLRRINIELRSEVLEPIYRRYPDLRAQDLTARDTSAIETSAAGQQDKGDPRNRRFGVTVRPGQIGRATSLRLRWIFSIVDKQFQAVASSLNLPESERAEQLTGTMINVMSETFLALEPVYAGFPELWREHARMIAPQDARTAENDATFRKIAPAPGSVRFTAAALSVIRKFLSDLQRELHSANQIAVVSWSSDMREKRSGDTEWKQLGPGLTIGAYSRSQVPPDVIQNFDGIPIVFVDDATKRFEGKLIDYRDGKFVLDSP